MYNVIIIKYEYYYYTNMYIIIIYILQDTNIIIIIQICIPNVGILFGRGTVIITKEVKLQSNVCH